MVSERCRFPVHVGSRQREVRMAHLARVALTLHLLSRIAAADTGEDKLFAFGYDAHQDFAAYDPHYRDEHDKLSKELESLHADLIRQQKAGRKTYCSRQVYLECRWLVYYTAD